MRAECVNSDDLNRVVRRDGSAITAKMKTQILGTQLQIERL
jgi:hypothetical protein